MVGSELDVIVMHTRTTEELVWHVWQFGSQHQCKTAKQVGLATWLAAAA